MQLLEQAVKTFMMAGGQTVNAFDAEQIGLYIGMMFEELAEVVRAVMPGCVENYNRTALGRTAADLEATAAVFKQQQFRGDIVRSDRENLLKELLDSAWVSVAAAYSLSNDTEAACQELARSNLSKIGPNGEVVRDPLTRKILKPDYYSPAQMDMFIDKPID